ncbi:MAG: fumarylacetoacetate hydrolase family protein [Bacteroidota bacterium]|jgi:acylpyruvate hydrolase
MKIICVGRNYAAHAKELNNAVEEEPVIFLKPDTALLNNNQDFYLPDFSNDIHYETEVVVKINKAGKHIDEKFAHRYYDSVSLGIDFTARDLQSMLKAKGLPWERAKAFDGSAVIGSFLPLADVGMITDLNFSMSLNGQKVQSANTSEMVFSVDKVIAFVSRFITLKTGDLIYTGTPQGVGKVNVGDNLVGFLGEKELFNFKVK